MVANITNDISLLRQIREGNEDAFKERIGNDFGEVRFVEAGVNGEFGFVTPVMTEGEYEEKAKAYPEILLMIRVEEEV